MVPVTLYSYVEDPPSVSAALKIVDYVNAAYGLNFVFPDGFPKNQHGFGNVKKLVPRLAEMARKGVHSFVIADLDAGECAPSLMRNWLKIDRLEVPAALFFRVAVREIESWIMADRVNFAKFLGIAIQNLPANPDVLADPKQYLLNLIAKKGKRRWHREMLPLSPSASIGPLYNEKLCEFVDNFWNIEDAASASPSLARVIKAFQ